MAEGELTYNKVYIEGESLLLIQQCIHIADDGLTCEHYVSHND